MNTITMIPIEQLLHHPQNPRLDLGDLTELTESIKSQGVLQNLTVVPEEDHYLVLIGNRRMEAAKQAGLAELPCAIVEMDETDQIATMLTENMHRSDLTLFEQVQGIQMMMDLGLTESQISEMTGFSRTTVKRRAEMAKLDKEKLKKTCAQLTMDDVDMLMKVKDPDKRNELLKYAGSSNFKWYVENEIKELKRAENYKVIKGILLQAGCIERNYIGIENFWNTYEFLPYKENIDLDEYKPGENILPEDDRELYFYTEYGQVKFWAEKRKTATADDENDPDEEEDAEEKEKVREAEEAWQRLEEIEKHAKESRAAFLENLTIKQKDNRKALEWLIVALVASNGVERAMMNLLPDDYDHDQLEELPKYHTETDLDLKWIREQIETNPQLYAQMMNGFFFNDEDSVQGRWNKRYKPEYCRNISMITGYEWLEEFGYPVSDEERAYLDGTLDCYEEEEAE